MRVVLDRQLRIPEESYLFDIRIKTLVLTEKEPEERASENVIFEALNFNEKLPAQVCDVLYRHEVQSVIIEGGLQTLQTFIEKGMWDEARIFTGKVQFKEGTPAPEISGNLISEEKIASDILKIYRND